MTRRARECCWEWMVKGAIVQCASRTNEGGVYCDAHCAESTKMFEKERAAGKKRGSK